MATDLAEILTDLRAAASQSSRTDPTANTDARIALSRLRPVLERLRLDGLNTGLPSGADPDAFSRKADRVHWVRLLEGACARLGNATATVEPAGRLTRFADAAAVTATLHVDTMTTGERWATTAAIARSAHHLTRAAAGGSEPPNVSRALIIAEASSAVLFHFATLDPPTADDNRALLRPVPNPRARGASVDDALLEAAAALEHATRPGSGPHSIADMLAVVSAAAATCQWASLPDSGSGVGLEAGSAGLAWLNVRDQLRPFDDGSRRPQTFRPPVVDHALTIHRLVRQAGAGRAEPDAAGPRATTLGVVAERLAAVAGHLAHAVAVGAATGQFMAFAADLPVRDVHVRQFVQGRRVTGLVTADAPDVAPVRAAMRRAQSHSAMLAADLGTRVDVVAGLDRFDPVQSQLGRQRR